MCISCSQCRFTNATISSKKSRAIVDAAVKQKSAYNILHGGAKEQAKIFSGGGSHPKGLKGSSAAEKDW